MRLQNVKNIETIKEKIRRTSKLKLRRGILPSAMTRKHKIKYLQ
jgi:hypothetical protein